MGNPLIWPSVSITETILSCCTVVRRTLGSDDRRAWLENLASEITLIFGPNS